MASRTALEGVRGRQLAFAGMRFNFVLTGLGLVVVGCAPVRRAVDWRPDPAPRMRPSLDVAHAPRPASSALACVDQPLVHAWERRMRRDFAQDTRETMARGARYLPELRQLVTDAGLPPSLALLPAIESGFEPQARGRFGELGLWQLRAATARRFGLVVDPQRDDRTDPARSTRAAVRYLRFLHRHYGDWPLAIAAYNAGEGRIDRALARTPHASFWDLAASGRLPRKSRDYVPHFLAVVRLNERTVACAPRPAAAQVHVAAAAPPPRSAPVRATGVAVRPAAAAHCDGSLPRSPSLRSRETGIALAAPSTL